MEGNKSDGDASILLEIPEIPEVNYPQNWLKSWRELVGLPQERC